MASHNMHLMKSAVLLIAAFTLVVSKRSRSALYAEHYQNVTKFKCLEPQPRIVPAAELSHALAGSDKLVVPHVTVLHRCNEDCGFCHSNRHCVAALDEQIVLVFSVTKVGGKETKLPVKVTNHTLCGCETPEDV